LVGGEGGGAPSSKKRSSLSVTVPESAYRRPRSRRSALLAHPKGGSRRQARGQGTKGRMRGKEGLGLRRGRELHR